MRRRARTTLVALIGGMVALIATTVIGLGTSTASAGTVPTTPPTGPIWICLPKLGCHLLTPGPH